jgi:hypothetical protein
VKAPFLIHLSFHGTHHEELRGHPLAGKDRDMDPDITLARLRAAINYYAQAQGSGSSEEADIAAADAIAAMVVLDSWLSMGGFLPAAWQAKHNGSGGSSPEEREDKS